MMDIITVYEIGGLLVTFIAAISKYVRSPARAKRRNTVIISLGGAMLSILVSIWYGAIPEMEKAN